MSLFPQRGAPIVQTLGAMRHPAVGLTLEARSLLLLGQRSLGDLLGLSRRTIQRWDAGKSSPASWELAKLATVVHPRDADLAAKLAASAGTTLEALGLAIPPPAAVEPAPAIAPQGPPPLSPRHLVDVVVCAAAEALNVAPPAVRPVLLAAFRKAREVGLKVEDVEGVLGPPTPAPGDRPAGARRAKNRR